MFQVMIQRHNRHMSISYYISALAVTDTIALLIGKFEPVFTVTHTDQTYGSQQMFNFHEIMFQGRLSAAR